jgi:hypothetical protein
MCWHRGDSNSSDQRQAAATGDSALLFSLIILSSRKDPAIMRALSWTAAAVTARARPEGTPGMRGEPQHYRKDREYRGVHTLNLNKNLDVDLVSVRPGLIGV